jgi:iron complex transport system substrate-binding protein
MRKTNNPPFVPMILAVMCSVFIFSCRKQTQEQHPRYVVLSPEVAEILAGLGVASDIVGVSKECDYPEELASIPKVGNFGMIDREAVIKLTPSIVFTTSLEQDAIASELQKLGYRVESVYPKTLVDMQQQILRLGKMLGKDEAALRLVSDIRSALDSLALINSGKARPRVYIEINRDPLMSVSDNSFVGQLLEAAGGDNVFGTLERDYCRVSPEDVVNAAPDIIICYSQDTMDNIRSRKGWQDIPAIRSGRIYFEKDIDPDLIQRAGPRIVLGLGRLRELYDGAQPGL